MFPLIDFLKGKKTYIVAALMIALGLLQNDQQLILNGLAVLTLRAGIAKIPAFPPTGPDIGA